MSLFSAHIHPEQGALGFLVLGASLHELLTRLKSEPSRFPKIDITYSPQQPVRDPVILTLPANGIRLRFDGVEQRLRLIEVLDFSKSLLRYNQIEIVRPPSESSPPPDKPKSIPGPTFRHVYRTLFGPSFDGEYIPPQPDDETGMGLYILSYPHIAFTFPLPHSAWIRKKEKDYVSLLSSAEARPAISMAIFHGETWAEARQTLYHRTLPYPRSLPLYAKSRDLCPEEVRLVRIHGEGRLELIRSSGTSTFLHLGLTTPQDLVAELGPPDAIFKRHDQRMAIHKPRGLAETRRRTSSVSNGRSADESDTEPSSANNTTDEDDHDCLSDENESMASSGERFYNYFYHGFDVMISSPIAPSRKPPCLESPDPNNSISSAKLPPRPPIVDFDPNRLVATKVILHSNVPGSYPFNRHRRCRWEIAYLPPSSSSPSSSSPKSSTSSNSGNAEAANTTNPLLPVSSESPFRTIATSLHEAWKSIYPGGDEEARQKQRGMVLNRGWVGSPGSSCEMIGEDDFGSVGDRKGSVGTGLGKSGVGNGDGEEENGLGNTTLYGFPGLVFEVLKSGFVSGVTVF